MGEFRGCWIFLYKEKLVHHTKITNITSLPTTPTPVSMIDPSIIDEIQDRSHCGSKLGTIHEVDMFNLLFGKVEPFLSYEDGYVSIWTGENPDNLRLIGSYEFNLVESTDEEFTF